MKASRYNEGKPKLSYFVRSFRWMLEAIARIKEFGANKYEDDNWRLGNKPDVEYLDSAQRHLDAFLGGEFYDPDSGCAHLGQIVWNFCALAELNYPHMPVIDEELFNKRMTYWAEKKRKKEKEPITDKLPVKFVMPDLSKVPSWVTVEEKCRDFIQRNLEDQVMKMISIPSEEQQKKTLEDLKGCVPENWGPANWKPEPLQVFDYDNVVDVTGDYLRAMNSPMPAPVFLDAPPDMTFEISSDTNFDTMQFRQDVREALKEIDKQKGDDE